MLCVCYFLVWGFTLLFLLTLFLVLSLAVAPSSHSLHNKDITSFGTITLGSWWSIYFGSVCLLNCDLKTGRKVAPCYFMTLINITVPLRRARNTYLMCILEPMLPISVLRLRNGTLQVTSEFHFTHHATHHQVNNNTLAILNVHRGWVHHRNTRGHYWRKKGKESKRDGAIHKTRVNIVLIFTGWGELRVAYR